MEEFLQDGMVALDIGAHIGEYALIAAGLAGCKGQVHVFEPQPLCAEMLRRNAQFNCLTNIFVHGCAVSDQDGHVRFHIDRRSMGGFMVRSGDIASVQVPCVTLDTFVKTQELPEVHLVKADAAGNERAVLLGGRSLFTAAKAPVLICKFYHPDVVTERHSYDAREIIATLADWNYELFGLVNNGRIPISSPEQAIRVFDDHTYGFPVLGIRRGALRWLGNIS
jgi:FkbM family methyltransferase